MKDSKWPSLVESKLRDQSFSDWINFIDENNLNIPRFSLDGNTRESSDLIKSSNVFCSGSMKGFSTEEKDLLKKFNIEKTYRFEEIKSKTSINLGQQELFGLNSVQKLGFFAQKLINILDDAFEKNETSKRIDCLVTVNSTFFEMISFVSSFRSLFEKISSSYNFSNSPKLFLWSIPDPSMQNKVFIEGNHLKNLYSALAAKLAGVDYVVAKNHHYLSEDKVFSTDLLAYMNLCLLDEEGGIGNLDKNITNGSILIENYQEKIQEKVWNNFIASGREKFLKDEEWAALAKSTETARKEKTIVGVNAFESKLFGHANFSVQGESHE